MKSGHLDVAGVVLAAGAGRRLAPLTSERPKALCPVDDVPLVDHGVRRIADHVGGTGSVAVNLHHGASALDAALDPSIHRSFEQPEPLGTAGALGALRPWLDGRAVLVTNADAWFGSDLDLRPFVDGWDRERTRLLCVEDPERGDFDGLRYCGVALIPAAIVARLDPVPSGLYEVSWRDERAAGRLDLVATSAAFIDCGTPADYLHANLQAVGQRHAGRGPARPAISAISAISATSAISASARIGDGAVVERSVVWSGAEVRAGEVLVDAIRTRTMTVLVREIPR